MSRCARTAGPMRRERGEPVRQSARRDQSRPRAWADRRDHDCHRLDDRVWHLHRFSGIIAIEWRAGLAVACLGARWIADDNRRAVLLGTGNDDAASARGLEIGKIVQNTFTVAKRAALTAVVVIGLSLAWKVNSAVLSSAWCIRGVMAESAGGAVRVRNHRHARAGAAFWKIDGPPALRPDRVDQCDIYRQGSARPERNRLPRLSEGARLWWPFMFWRTLLIWRCCRFRQFSTRRKTVAVATMEAVSGRPGAMCIAAAIMISTFG